MNYRHGFHAGNFADVFKHTILARILVYLTRKDRAAALHRHPRRRRALRPRQRGGAALARMARRRRAPDEGAAAGRDRRSDRTLSPGDRAVRPNRGPPVVLSRLAGAGANAAEAAGSPRALRGASGGARRAGCGDRARRAAVSIVGTDGYVALNAYVPPQERRGLALIDPPYEAPDEASKVEAALRRALAKWPRGTYALWRPIKDEREDAHFLNAIAAIGAPNMLRLEIDVGAVAPGPHSPAPLQPRRTDRHQPAVRPDRGGARAHALADEAARPLRRRCARRRMADAAGLDGAALASRVVASASEATRKVKRQRSAVLDGLVCVRDDDMALASRRDML